MKYHQAIIGQDKITYQPYIHNLREDFTFIGVGLLLWLIGGICVLSKDVTLMQGALVCFGIGILAIFVGIYRSTFLSRVIIIVDSKTRSIYKRQPWTSPSKAMDFDNVHSVITTSEYGSFYYCLTRKSNRFGRNMRISNDFRAQKMKPPRLEFEESILPAIVEMVGINRRSNVVVSESHLYSGKIQK